MTEGRGRLSAISGDVVNLNTTFYQGGKAADPFAIREVRIYRGSIREDNLVTKVVIPVPTDPTYPQPIQRVLAPPKHHEEHHHSDQSCPSVPEYLPGTFVLPLYLPTEEYRTGVYYDVWFFIGHQNDTGAEIGSDGEVTCSNPPGEEIWQRASNKFFVVEGGWFVDDDLSTIRLGFEPLDSRYTQPERRTLEVGMMPLPLYDFDYKKIMPILPFLEAKITIETQYNEIIICDEPMSVGERTGSYKTSPFVLRYLFDSKRVLKGTYKYRIDVTLPNGETRSSPYFNLAVR